MPKKTFTIMVIINLLRAYFKSFSNFGQLISLEARLAGKALNRIIFLVFLISLLLFSTWFSLLVILFLSILSLNFSPLTAAFVILICNLLLLITVFILIKIQRKNLYFSATRRQLAKSSFFKRST